MEKAPSQNIQDAFLNTARRERMTVLIHLLHGATLSGRIKSFDKFSVLLDVGGQDFLIFKHAISTISQEQRKRPDFAPAPASTAATTTTTSTTTAE
ncbi:MAG TPA: RNA chaperone Hfq [Pyrinomonadaceae bacterium]|jgi:host factor-I protein